MKVEFSFSFNKYAFIDTNIYIEKKYESSQSDIPKLSYE